MKPPRDITIKPVLNGYVVQVGCQVLAFNSRSDLLHELQRYFEDPEGVEKAYRGNALHAEMIMLAQIAPGPTPTAPPPGEPLGRTYSPPENRDPATPLPGADVPRTVEEGPWPETELRRR